MTEQALQKKIIDMLTARGFSVFKTIATNRRGIADIIACSPTGRFIAIEVKRSGLKRTLTPLQRRYLDEVTHNGGVAACVDSLEEIESIVESAL